MRKGELKMNKIRVGMIGCGAMMQGHIRWSVEIPEAEIVALVEPSEASLERTFERFPQLKELPTFDDHRKMIESVKPDAVVIGTPHTFHYPHIMDSLAAGCHVLVEKPMVCSVKEAEEVVAKQAENDKVVLIGYQRHTDPLFRRMKGMIEEGELGEITFVNCLQNQRWYRLQLDAIAAGHGWRYDPELSGGGQLNDSGSHLVDALLWIIDLKPEVVHCFQQNFDLAVDVNSSINVRFTNGAAGSISIVGESPGIGGSVWEDITILGTEGALYYRMLAQPGYQPVLEYRRFDTNEPLSIDLLPERSNPDENFFNAILGKESCYSPPVCGLRVMQLSEAAWKSAETGDPVHVDHAA